MHIQLEMSDFWHSDHANPRGQEIHPQTLLFKHEKRDTSRGRGGVILYSFDVWNLKTALKHSKQIERGNIRLVLISPCLFLIIAAVSPLHRPPSLTFNRFHPCFINTDITHEFSHCCRIVEAHFRLERPCWCIKSPGEAVGWSQALRGATQMTTHQ